MAAARVTPVRPPPNEPIGQEPAVTVLPRGEVFWDGVLAADLLRLRVAPRPDEAKASGSASPLILQLMAALPTSTLK